MQESITRSELTKRLGTFKECNPISSTRTTSAVANQYDILFENGSMFQSYNTLIAAQIGNIYYFTDDYAYSKTTSKYCTKWSGFTRKEITDGLNNGQFIKII